MKVTTGVGGRGTKTSIDRKAKLSPSDYQLHRIEIENGDNGGATVKLHHRLKKEVEAKHSKGDHYVDYDQRHMETTHPFEKRSKAMKFAKSALNEVESPAEDAAEGAEE